MTAKPRPAAADGPGDRRADEAAAADHAAIERLVEGLLPTLAARLRLGDLDELEIREGGWRVRLRRPGGFSGAPPSSLPEGGAGLGTGGATPPRAGTTAQPRSTAASARLGATNPTRATAAGLVGIGPTPGASGPERGAPRGRARRPVTSPAVGLFRPAPSFTVGKRVRAGDRLGTIDVLGVPHDVVAPLDGLVVEVGVEAGQPVEYGQDLGTLEALGPELIDRAIERGGERTGDRTGDREGGGAPRFEGAGTPSEGAGTSPAEGAGTSAPAGGSTSPAGG